MKSTSYVGKFAFILFAVIFILVKGGNALAAFGDLDASFSNNGIKTDNGAQYFPRAIVRQADGKIVVAGVAQDQLSGHNSLMVRRYLADGTVDSEFGSGGTAISYNVGGSLFDVVVQADGKIVVVGQAPYPLQGTSVWRFKTDGWYDPTFGNAGRVDRPGNGICRVATYMPSRTSPTELIVACVGGEIYRLKSNGSTDTNFGNGGSLTADLAGAGLTSLALRSQRIYVAGGNHIARFTMTGQPDTAFGDQGVFSEDQNPGCLSPINATTWYQDLAFQSDGSLVSTGFEISGAYPVPNYKLRLARHGSNGNFDASFLSMPCSGNSEIMAESVTKALRVQQDDRLLLADRSRVERRTSVGTYEDSFAPPMEISDLLLLPDGRILVVGLAQVNGTPRPRLSQHLP